MILAIEAASADLSLALCRSDGTVLAEDAWTSERRQSAELLPRIMALLERAGADLGAVSAIGVGIGPGSFTGLRVAMALAKGLAVSGGTPLVGVGSLEAWLAAVPRAEAAVARAGARDAFVLRRGDASPTVETEDIIRPGLADRPVVAPSDVAAAFGLETATAPNAAAAVAAATARSLAERPDGDDVRLLEPTYGRVPRGVGERR